MLFRNDNQFVGFPIVVGVMGGMSCSAEDHKVGQSVISFIMINMMHYFSTLKRASKMFSHYVSVFRNVVTISLVSIFVSGSVNEASFSLERSPSFPCWIFSVRPIPKNAPTFSRTENGLFSTLSHAELFTFFARKCVHCVSNAVPIFGNVVGSPPFVSFYVGPRVSYGR